MHVCLLGENKQTKPHLGRMFAWIHPATNLGISLTLRFKILLSFNFTHVHRDTHALPHTIKSLFHLLASSIPGHFEKLSFCSCEQMKVTLWRTESGNGKKRVFDNVSLLKPPSTRPPPQPPLYLFETIFSFRLCVQDSLSSLQVSDLQREAVAIAFIIFSLAARLI